MLYFKQINPEFSHWVNNEPFILNLNGDENTPMCDLTFWKWLEQNETGNYIKDKLLFLKSQGFVKGLDYLTSKQISILTSCNKHYYWVKIHCKN